MEEVLLEGNGNGRLARGGETSEPDGGTLLLAEVGTLLTGKTGVPGDVAVAFVRKCEMLSAARPIAGSLRGTTGLFRATDQEDSRCHCCGGCEICEEG